MDLRRLVPSLASFATAVIVTGCGYPEFRFDGDVGEAPRDAAELDAAELDVTTDVVDSETDAAAAGDAPPDEGADASDAGADVRSDAPDSAPVDQTVVAFGATWRYRDDGVAPPSAWRGAGSFDDATWKSGTAPLGYGDPTIATTIGYGGDAAAKHPTTWFRRVFTIDDAAKYDTLVVRIQRDDGAVVWVNGVEVVRTNMPSGTISSTTFASTTIGGGAEATVHTFEVPITPARTGSNVVAVEVHQANATSSDLRFDLELVVSRP